MQIGELASILTKPKRQSDGSFLACCPSHADAKQSLHVSQKEGKLLLKCFAGCTTESICQSLNIELSALFTEEKQPERKIVATYTYQDEEGKELYQVVRFEPKGFQQRHKNDKGEYIYKMDGVRRVLYHLPDIMLSDIVYIVEGEKDADNLWSWGRIATTSVGGASGWKSEYTAYLNNKKIIIIPDKDKAGFDYAKSIIKPLKDVTKDIKVIILPGKAKDISEWYEQGGDNDLLDSLEQDPSVLEKGHDAPVITKTITGYTFKWVDFTVNIRRVDVHKDGRITGDITIETESAKLLPSTQYNFSAGNTRKILAKDLLERDSTHDWANIIQFICDEVQTRARTGDEGQVIEANDDEIIRPPYIVEPIVMEGVPSVIYGDKGKKKTSLCLALIGCMALGWQENPFGFAVDPKPRSVAFLDWESNWDLTKYNILRLRRGMGFPYFKFAYRNCRFSLADDLDAIQVFLDQHHVEVIIIDSLGAACGGDLFKPEPALKFFSALRQLPATTSLIIAQNSKNDDNKKSIFGSTYFQYYSRNIFEVKVSDSAISETEMSIGIFHKEGNYSKKYKPIGLHVTDTDDSMVFQPEELHLADFVERIKQSETVIAFLGNGEKTVEEIANHINASVNVTRVVLSRLKKKGSIVNMTFGKWSIPQQKY